MTYDLHTSWFGTGYHVPFWAWYIVYIWTSQLYPESIHTQRFQLLLSKLSRTIAFAILFVLPPESKMLILVSISVRHSALAAVPKPTRPTASMARVRRRLRMEEPTVLSDVFTVNLGFVLLWIAFYYPQENLTYFTLYVNIYSVIYQIKDF